MEEMLNMDMTEAKEYIYLGECLERLMNNQDFKKVILEHYLKDEPVRLTYLRSDSAMMNSKDREANLAYNNQLLDGIASFYNFMDMTRRLAASAKLSIQDYEEAMKEIAEQK